MLTHLAYLRVLNAARNAEPPCLAEKARRAALTRIASERVNVGAIGGKQIRAHEERPAHFAANQQTEYFGPRRGSGALGSKAVAKLHKLQARAPEKNSLPWKYPGESGSCRKRSYGRGRCEKGDAERLKIKQKGIRGGEPPCATPLSAFSPFSSHSYKSW